MVSKSWSTFRALRKLVRHQNQLKINLSPKEAGIDIADLRFVKTLKLNFKYIVLEKEVHHEA